MQDRIEEVIVVLHGKGTRLRCELNPQMIIAKDVEATIALSKLVLYNAFPNVSTGVNNRIKIQPGENAAWITVSVSTGSYELDELYQEILHELSETHKVKEPEKSFVLEPHLPTLHAMISLRNSWKVSFDLEHSLADLLGFDKKKILVGDKRHMGEQLVNINNLHSLIVMCDVARPSYLNGRLTSYILNYPVYGAPGAKIVYAPSHLTYVPLVNNVISTINVWLKDQSLGDVDIRKETVEVELRLRLRHSHNKNLDANGNVIKRKK